MLQRTAVTGGPVQCQEQIYYTCVCVCVCLLPVTLLTLQYEVVLRVLSLTERTAAQTITWSTATVVILPITVQPRGGGATLDTPHTPEDNIHTVREDNTHLRTTNTLSD